MASGATLSGTGTTGAVTVNGGTCFAWRRRRRHAKHGQPRIYHGLPLTSGPDEVAAIRSTSRGTVNLGNASLLIASTRADIADDVLVLIKNDGADSVTGTFLNLSEGA